MEEREATEESLIKQFGGASRRAEKKGIIIVYTAKVSDLSSQNGGTEGGIIRQGFLPLFKDASNH